MSNVAVEKVRGGEITPPSIFERMTDLMEKVRLRAFQIFENRGGAEGRSLDDWLQAERDLIEYPETELVEKDGKFQVKVAVPGFDSKDIHIAATPMTLFVQAEAKHNHEKKDGDVYLCEFGRKQLFRRLDLPAPVNVDKVTATLDHGILELSAPKTVDAANKVKAVTAA